MADFACASCGRVLSLDFRFCPYCGVEVTQTPKCPNCGYENEANFNFCQKCGHELTAQAAVPQIRRGLTTTSPSTAPGPPPSEGITIEFPFSTSQTFEFAVEAARAIPTFQQFGEDKKAIYRATLARGDIANASELLEHLKGWRRRAVYVDGEKLPWDSVFGYSWCFERKKGSFKPEFYCFGYDNDYESNIWGCVQAHLPFADNSEWCTWGRWLDNKGNWEFDKARITHELQKRLFPFRFCPALQPDLVNHAIDAIPSPVNPSKDRNWKFVERWGDDATPGLTVTVDRYGFKQTVVMRGVAPNGAGALRDIAARVGNRIPIRM
jgi:RNA polymerase subunit RPABC4/transcription elongation factor Spt4